MRILHLFNWRLNDINILKIKEQGFNAIQINPLQPLKSDATDWWLSYQPIDYTIGNKFGSREDLIELCKKAKELGIIVIADVVINHVAGDDFGNIIPHEKVSKKILDNPSFFKSFDRIYDWDNRYDVITKSIGVPGLNLSNLDLQRIIFNFFEDYISCGIGGFRIDAAKNIELPWEGSSFWSNFKNQFGYRNLFNYAELIFCDNGLMNDYSNFVNILSESNIYDKNKLITFTESHDTFLEFGYTRRMDGDMLINEYEILCQHYPNVLFYARPYDPLWEDEKVKKINFDF